MQTKAMPVVVSSAPLSVPVSRWLAEPFACITDAPVPAGCDGYGGPLRVRKLLLADMDATMIAGESLDEIAAHAGIGPKVAEITRRAMAGELDFHTALAERMALLAGFPYRDVEAIIARTVLNPGARELVATMKAHGAYTVLVSGGFQPFTAHVAALCGFDRHIGNILDVKDGLLTGRVVEPVVDKDTKLAVLHAVAAQRGISLEDTLAIGDGANDSAMIHAAGLGIGYYPKPALASVADAVITHTDLKTALYFQGITPD